MEKVLAVGKFKVLNSLSIVCFGIAVVAWIVCIVVAVDAGGSCFWAFEGIEYGYYWFFIGIVLFIIIGYLLMRVKRELKVSNYRIVGVIGGDRVDLPVDQISAIKKGIFKHVTITTPSGRITMFDLENAAEVYNCIAKLLVERQQKKAENE